MKSTLAFGVRAGLEWEAGSDEWLRVLRDQGVKPVKRLGRPCLSRLTRLLREEEAEEESIVRLAARMSGALFMLSSPRRCCMKASLSISVLAVMGMMGTAVALANPALLPQHPGYPMGKATDPVNGQLLANDPGRANGGGESALSGAAAFDDGHVTQKLSINDQNQRLLEKPGAGILPKVQGPNIVIDPPVKEGTKVQASPR